MSQNDLEVLLNKICVTLETSIEGFRTSSAAITSQNVLVVCFFYEGEENEDAVYLLGSEWSKMSFFDLCQTLIERIHASVANENSQQVH